MRSHITRQTLREDAIAGLTGATIALPQSVAFAAIAGLPPEYGFYSSIVIPIVAAVFGSSFHAVPTGGPGLFRDLLSPALPPSPAAGSISKRAR